MAHTSRGRPPPVACPLATLGRASPPLDAQGYHHTPLENQAYHHPLSSSPLDPQVYQLSRNSPSFDRDSPVLEQPYRAYRGARSTPSVDLNEQYGHQILEQYTTSKKSTSSVDSQMYHLSRSSSSSLDQPYHSKHTLEAQVYQFPRSTVAKTMEQSYVRQSPSTFDHFRLDAAYHLGQEAAPNARVSQPYTNAQVHHQKTPINLRQNSLDAVYQERYHPKTDLATLEQYNMRADKLYSPTYHLQTNLRNSPALRRASSPTTEPCNFLVDSFSKLGRSSPSLDQGYHTLVSPSPGPSTPGPWADPGNVLKGKKVVSKTTPFDRLPDQAVVKIFQWLDSCELCVVARVCKRFEVLAWEPSLWRTIVLNGEHLSGDRAVRGVLRRLCGQGRTGACPSVERVFLRDGCRLTDRGLTLMARRCPELTHLQIQGSAVVSNMALFELATRCTNLQHLDITGCARITCIGVTPGPEPPRRLLLQYLDLTDCAAVEDAGLRVIVRNCPQLVYLYLRRCMQITDAGLKFIPSFCASLRELSVSDCANVTDFGLYELAKLGASLRYLSVAKCDQVSDAGLKVIARRCYKLRYLNARGCEAVSDDAITVLARSCPRLRALDIGKCDVSDAGLRALAESCPNLKKLSLRNCDLVTDRGVQCVAYYCRGLQQLNIQDCQISLEGYRAVKKYCKRCVIEHTNPGFF